MAASSQTTLAREVSVQGIGLHSGRAVHLDLRPAPPDTGIVFERRDLPGGPAIPALWPHVVECRHATTLGRDGVRVGLVEHVLATLLGLGVDNARVVLDAEEVPILDGSASGFVSLIREAGVCALGAPRRFLALIEPVRVSDGDREAVLEPASDFIVGCVIDYPHPLVGSQEYTCTVTPEVFAAAVAPARTFGFLSDVSALRAAGLAHGGSLDNAVVLDQASVLNVDGLRFRDEFVRHKVLDAIGDLALCGAPLRAAYSAYKSGHALNVELVRAVVSSPTAWCWVEENGAPVRAATLPSGR